MKNNSQIGFPPTFLILDCSGISSGWGVKVNGSYWNITKMTIKNAPDCGIVFQKGGYDGNGNTGHITVTGSTGGSNGKSLWYRIY